MNASKIFLGIAFLISLLAFVGTVAAWAFGYAHGGGAGLATLGLFVLTVGLGISVASMEEGAGVSSELPSGD